MRKALKQLPPRRRSRRKPRRSAAAAAPGKLYTDAASFTATQAKNEFGRVLETAVKGTPVMITKHDEPKAVLISIEGFRALSPAHRESPGATLGDAFSMLARMQTEKWRAAMKAAFEATSDQLSKVALKAARSAE